MKISLLSGTALLGFLAWKAKKNYARVKSSLDRVFALAILIFTSPLFLAIVLLIKLSLRGPVFYVQERVGKHGKVFRMYKFRTMHCDSENGTGPVWATRYDERVFPLGRFLRRHHLDEFPQFVNVLKGQMSIVGPRPERPYFVRRFIPQIPEYQERLRITPGITGYAQVCQDYDATLEDVRKKLAYDLLYIREMSLKRDLQIVLYSLRVMVTGRLLSGQSTEQYLDVYRTIAEPKIPVYSREVSIERFG